MINLIFSTSDRIDLFEDTITSLIKFNPGINDIIENVYVLDDRSKLSNRNIIELLIQQYFPNKGRLITFNDSSHHFAYVKKFDFIKNLSHNTPYTLFIEEDWRSIDHMDLSSHLDFLIKNPEVDQIVFSEHFHFQDEDVKEKTSMDEVYWDMNKTDLFKHTYGFSVNETNQMFFKWLRGKPIFTFNPSLIRNTVFLNNDFSLIKDWEYDFHEKVQASQVATKIAKFIHTGEHRSAEGKTWG